MRRDNQLFIDVSCDVGNEDLVDTPVFADSSKSALQTGSLELFRDTREGVLTTSKPKHRVHYFA